MKPEERLKELFAQALEKKSPADRENFLTGACQDQPELRSQVESLLRAYEQAGDFLGQTIKLPPAEFESELPGTMIGRYKLLEKIGEGGFGVVYMAEQQEPVQRKVALKVIKPGMETREVIARFEAERQALALMDHPNIARVLDGGATEAQRPYFVMELVRGIPITDYCDQANLPTGDRLQLFMKVCQAVQHAHQKGVIHRDVKPSNVLVTLHDGEPVPKVIDFGVAKALGPKLTQKTLFTGFARMIGTPAYMSPEQAEMSGLDIDTRSDIYSLGVLLYELLTGVTPFDKETLAKAGLDEIRRIIRETEPPKPSTRLRTLGDKLPQVAMARHTEPAALSRIVRGDLDWIVMKCLEKDRTRRYETANGLGADVKRFLNNELVTAAAPGTLYRARKFARRHKAGLATATTFGLLLGTGTLISTWEAVRARRAEYEQTLLRRQAEEANLTQTRLRLQAQADREKSQLEAARSRQVAEFLEDMLRGVGPSVALGRDTGLLSDILDKTVERLAKDLKDQPEVEADLRYTIGNVYQDLAAHAKAERMHREALAIYRRLFGDAHPKVANALDGLGNALNGQGKREDAERLLRQALTIEINWFGFGGTQEAMILHDLAYVLQWERKLAEAEALNRRSLEIRRKQLGEKSLLVAFSLNNLGLVLQAEGNVAEAESMFRNSLLITRNILGNDNPNVAMSLFNLAQLLRADGNYREAESLHREALDIRRRVLGTDHPDVGASIGQLSSVLRTEGNLSSLSFLYKEQLAALRSRVAAHDPELVAPLEQLAVVQLALGEFAEMEPTARECLAIRQATRPKDWRTSATRAMVGASLLGQKKYAEAETELISGYEGMESQRASLPEEGAQWMGEAARDLAQVYEAAGRPDRAAQWHNRETNVQALVQGAASRARGLGHAQRGEWRDAVASFARAVQLDPAEHWSWFQLAPLLADTDLVAYGNHRHAMLSFFAGANDPWVAERTAKACLLLPSTRPDLAIASRLAGTAGGIVTNDAWIHLTLALTAYRESHFAESAEWAQKALVKPGEKPKRDAAAYMILAMSLHQLKQPQPALVALNRGTGIFENTLVKFEAKDLGPDFQDWFIAKILRDEAETLMGELNEMVQPLTTNALGLVVPARDLKAGPNIVDLSDYYNAGLKGNWHGGDPENDLAELRAGVRTLASIQFDVRALVQLGNRHFPQLARFPEQVEGIPIRRKCRRVHFLHAAIYGWDPDGTEVGKYVFHFVDAKLAEKTITLGEDILDWWASPEQLARASKIVIAWDGSNGNGRREQRRIHLFKSVWDNPTPDVEVTALDFVSAQAGDSAAFLVAITIDP